MRTFLIVLLLCACTERPRALLQADCVGPGGGEWLPGHCLWVSPGGPLWDPEYYRLL